MPAVPVGGPAGGSTNLMSLGCATSHVEFPGHVGAALVAYSPIAFVALRLDWVRLALVGTVVTIGLASLPDVDNYGSRLTHRGYSHTVWFALVVGAGTAGAFAGAGDLLPGPSTAGLTAFGFAVGTAAILSHLAVDALTPMGVAPIAPLRRRRYSLGLTRSADPVANRRLLLLGLVTAALSAVLGTVFPSPVG